MNGHMSLLIPHCSPCDDCNYTVGKTLLISERTQAEDLRGGTGLALGYGPDVYSHVILSGHCHGAAPQSPPVPEHISAVPACRPRQMAHLMHVYISFGVDEQLSCSGPVCPDLYSAHVQCTGHHMLMQVITYASEAYGRMILEKGLFQADGHPGNMLVMPGGRVGLIDYGQSKQLAANDQRLVARLIVALTSCASLLLLQIERCQFLLFLMQSCLCIWKDMLVPLSCDGQSITRKPAQACSPCGSSVPRKGTC